MTIEAAIHSQSDNGQTIRRVNACLAQYFEPDHDPQTKADMRQSFVRALACVPKWAMHKAFDLWERTGTRRPTPAEIVILAERELQPLAEELARRRADEARVAEEQEAAAKRRVSPQAAARIMAEAGMTPERAQIFKRFPMANSEREVAEIQAEQAKPAAHWSDTAPPDDPRWDALRKSRAASPLLRETLTRQDF